MNTATVIFLVAGFFSGQPGDETPWAVKGLYPKLVDSMELCENLLEATKERGIFDLAMKENNFVSYKAECVEAEDYNDMVRQVNEWRRDRGA